MNFQTQKGSTAITLEIWLAFTITSAILQTTFLTLAALNIIIWALLVGKLRALFARPKILARLNKAGGGFLIGAGLITAAARN